MESVGVLRARLELERVHWRMTGTPPDTLMAALGIEVTEATPERVVATMTVDGRVHQPYGILHGGASVALAETVASVGGTLSVGEGKRVVGLEINASLTSALFNA